MKPRYDVGDLQARKQLLCSICRQPYGACIQCGGSSHCFTAFHPLCARSEALVMESQHDEHFLQDDSPVKAQPPCTDGVEAEGFARPTVKRRKLDGRQSFVEGTAVGDGTRLVRVFP